MQISVPVTFDATNQTMSVSDSSLITFPQNTSDFSIVTVNGIDCITPTTVSTSNTHYVQFGIASSVEETEFDAYIDISNTQYSFNYWFELVSNGSPNQYSLVYNSGGVWWNPDSATVNLPTQQWYTVKIVNNDSIKIYDKSTGTLVHSRSFAGSLNVVSLANFYGATSYLANLTLKRTINTDLIRYANTSGIAEIWANIKNWVSAHIGNGTLTIQKNGTNVTTFSANSSSNATANITVPTKVSDLTNDSGFLTTANIPSKTSDLTNDSGFLTSHQSLRNYVTLDSSQILTATKNFTTNINTSSTSTTSRETWRLVFYKNSADTDSTAAAQIGLIQGANASNFAAILRLANPRANNKPTTGNTGNCWSGIGVYYNYDENKGYPYALNCWDWPASSNSGNELASTSWVRTYCETTKGFLTSHQSLSNYVTLNGEQTISGNKTFTGTLTGTLTGNCSGSSGSCTGNAATATQFSANKAVTLTGDVTGTASSKAGWSVATTLANSGVTAGSYGPSADVTGNNNATISVPQITVDAKGRVTSVTNRTLTCKNNTYSVYNKTLTIQKNGTNVATFTSNSSTDVTANITVPTKTSELTNDSGYLTSHQSLSNYVTLNSAQTITGSKTFTYNVALKNTAITNHKKIPSSDISNIAYAFWSNDNKFWGAISHNYLTTGHSVMRFEISNWTTSGSQGWWALEHGVDKAFSQVYFRPGGSGYCNLGDTSHTWKGTYSQEYHAYNANAFMANQGGYTFLIRNDGGSTYFLMSAQNGDEGTWTKARPLTIDNSTGVCSINGNANTAYDIAASNYNVVKGTNPSSQQWIRSWIKYEKTGTAVKNRLSEYRACVNTDGSVDNELVSWRFASGSTGSAVLGVKCKADGSGYAYCPTPATSDNSTKIATTAFVKSQGYITSSGTSANVTGTVAVAHGGTGATTRLGAVKALTDENVGTSTQYFLTITQNWGKAGYCSVANAKSVLGIPNTQIGSRNATGTWTISCAVNTLTYIYIFGTLTGNSSSGGSVSVKSGGIVLTSIRSAPSYKVCGGSNTGIWGYSGECSSGTATLIVHAIVATTAASLKLSISNIPGDFNILVYQ